MDVADDLCVYRHAEAHFKRSEIALAVALFVEQSEKATSFIPFHRQRIRLVVVIEDVSFVNLLAVTHPKYGLAWKLSVL